MLMYNPLQITYQPILSGYTIFKLVDTYGLPLEFAIDLLPKSNLSGFNVLEFAQAASKSWPAKRTYETLMTSKPLSCPRQLIQKAIMLAYS